MPTIHDCADAASLLAGMREARGAISRGECIVIPTDTVYGIAVDAFSAEAVGALLEAKGRGRESPPPVLVADGEMGEALTSGIPEEVRSLIEAHWPGALTVIFEAQPSLSWDLGDTGGTVALRVPDHPIALEMLRETGPLAVSSANRHGDPAATTAQGAADAFGDTVSLVLDAGTVGQPPEPGAVNGSTIVDCSKHGEARIVRQGLVPRAAIEQALGDFLVG